MAVLESGQFEQLVSEVKEQILAQSQGVGEIQKVTSLSGVYSLPALKGTTVVEAPIELLSRPAEEAALRADEAVRQAIEGVNNAISNAEDTASHPTYIGDDNYVYVWDKSTKSYNKTAIYTRGEGFSISKTYVSIEAMMSDKNHGLKEGDFVLINTNDVENPDNAKIYVVGSGGEFNFLVDMSGAIGFTGKTPQFEIGEVTAGDNKVDSSASVTSNGFDADGNPKYLLNLRVPSISFSDLTEEDIYALQSPARDMIGQLEETDEAVKRNEELRILAEGARADAELLRVETESARQGSELARAEAELARSESETSRILNEEARSSSEIERNEAEQARKESESARVEAENSRVSSEEERSAAELERMAQEDARVLSEQSRAFDESERERKEAERGSSESLRIESERSRVAAENLRKENESTRKASEQVRAGNEAERVSAESQRKTEYASLKNDILKATSNANDAAAESRNTPIIQDGTWWIWNAGSDSYVNTNTPATSRSPKIENGTWWVWDDTAGVYADTGQSVSADYVLTKANIEGVFTGNIQSHWHDRYVEKVEGKVLSDENFTSAEKQKLSTLENFDPTDVNNSIKALEEAMPTKVSELTNDAGYLTSHQDISHLATKAEVNGKQDTIADLDSIREGAGKGATALQSVPSEYVTETELAAKGFATVQSLSGYVEKEEGKGLSDENFTAEEKQKLSELEDFVASEVTQSIKNLEEAMPTKVSDLENDAEYVNATSFNAGLSLKQNLNTYVTNVSAANWIQDDSYEDFKYRCDIPIDKVTENTLAEVVFSVAQAVSGAYAPVCETGNGTVSIWSASSDAIVIPTILIFD